MNIISSLTFGGAEPPAQPAYDETPILAAARQLAAAQRRYYAPEVPGSYGKLESDPEYPPPQEGDYMLYGTPPEDWPVKWWPITFQSSTNFVGSNSDGAAFVRSKWPDARHYMVFSFYSGGVQQPTRIYRTQQTGPDGGPNLGREVPISGTASQNANLTAAYRTQASVTDARGNVWELLETIDAPGHQ